MNATKEQKLLFGEPKDFGCCRHKVVREYQCGMIAGWQCEHCRVVIIGQSSVPHAIKLDHKGKILKVDSDGDIIWPDE